MLRPILTGLNAPIDRDESKLPGISILTKLDVDEVVG
jgi:hypothetical protein